MASDSITTESLKPDVIAPTNVILAHPFMSLPLRPQGNVPKIFDMSK